jgi:hypothetical protein
MQMLKLAALDDEDLAIISAHVQDAVMKVEQLSYWRAAKQFTLTMNRFVWEAAGKAKAPHERRQSVLSFSRVLSAKSHGIDMKAGEEVLSLLAIRFAAADAPAGTVDLVFAGNATIRLDVECIEARLTDMGGAWRAASRPDHRA